MKKYTLIDMHCNGPDGEYYLVSEVEATMIPRPDPEVVRKAINRLIDSIVRYGDLPVTDEISKADAALLKLLGVE